MIQWRKGYRVIDGVTTEVEEAILTRKELENLMTRFGWDPKLVNGLTLHFGLVLR